MELDVCDSDDFMGCEERLLKYLQRLDSDSNRSISREELAQVFSTLEPDVWDDIALDLLMSSVDVAKDDTIQYEELVAWLFAEGESNGNLLEREQIMQKSHKFILERCGIDPTEKEMLDFYFECFREEECDDSALVRQAVAHEGTLLRFASPRLQDDFFICSLAIQQNPRAMEHCSERLRGDLLFMQAAVTTKTRTFGYASQELRDFRDLARIAVANDECALCHASTRLQGDREFVLSAVRSFSKAFQYASEELHRDKDFALLVYQEQMKEHPLLDEWSGGLRDDVDVSRAAIDVNCLNFKKCSRRLQSDPDFVRWAVHKTPPTHIESNIITHMSPELRGNMEVACALVTCNPQLLESIPEALRGDPQLVGIAVDKDGVALQFALQTFRDDEDIVTRSVLSNGLALEHASARLRDNGAIVHAAVSQNGRALEFASERLRDQWGIVRAAMYSDESALLFASTHVSCDPSVKDTLRRLKHVEGDAPVLFCKCISLESAHDSTRRKRTTWWHFPLGLRKGMPAQLLHEASYSHMGLANRSDLEVDVACGSVTTLEPPFAMAVIEWDRHVRHRSWAHHSINGDHDVGSSGWSACDNADSLCWQNFDLASAELQDDVGGFSVPAAAMSLLNALDVEKAKVPLQICQINQTSDEGKMIVLFSALNGDTVELEISADSSVEFVAAELAKKRDMPSSVKLLLVGRSGELLKPTQTILDHQGS